MAVSTIKSMPLKRELKGTALINTPPGSRRTPLDGRSEALIKPNFIKEYPNDTPLKSYLLLGYTGRNRPLHVVAAPDEDSDILWIITVYEPDKDKWNKDFTKRR
ncbi:DUF4258 domain-containing protein [Rhodohalobacter halophilus]|uniref:DUF4258 domain-containing protein n=1 Tax=Rhodohalobacter halophilus TaxID=1812810 RepID=UPI001C4075DB|nr:DUF4258 domain-containing protein [Rhodohalobacter halophilus]